MKPVTHKEALRKRMTRFWENTDSSESKLHLMSLVTSLETVGHVAVFGGMVRDFATMGASYFRSDIDLVLISEDIDYIRYLLKQYPCELNKLGGWKIKCGLWSLDLWPLHSTWAFSKNLVRGQDFSDLIRTTFFNWDAAVFELQSKKIYIDETYIESIRSKILDINLEENPNPAGMLFRTLKFMHRDKASITPKLAYYLARTFEENRSDIYYHSIKGPISTWLDREGLGRFEKQLFEHLDKTPLFAFSLAHRQNVLF